VVCAGWVLLVLTVLESGAMTTQFAGRPYKPPSVAEAELGRYVYQFNPRVSTLPKDLDPDDVAAFVTRGLREATVGITAASQLVEVADFYDLERVVPDLLARLKKQEDTRERFLVSLALTRGVGILASGEQETRGFEYLRHLMSLPFAAANVQGLLACFSEFSEPGRNEVVGASLRGLMAGKNTQAGTDAAAETRAREVEDLLNNVLPRIVKAEERKRQILALPDRPARLDALVDVYLNLDARYREWMDRWAARQLLEEARRRGTDDTVAAFRRALPRLEGAADSRDALSSLRAVCLRAIEFLGGALSEEEIRQSRTVPAVLVGLLTLD
jgi:hypothetical protein